MREDSLTLFGFATRDELDVFDLLIGVTGVGPKSALGVLSALSPAAGRRGRAARRRRGVPQGQRHRPEDREAHHGLPRRQALRDRAATARPVAITGGAAESVLAALTGLGWSERVAAEAVDETIAAASDAEAASVPTLLRLTLSRLGPAQQPGRSR